MSVNTILLYEFMYLRFTSRGTWRRRSLRSSENTNTVDVRAVRNNKSEKDANFIRNVIDLIAAFLLYIVSDLL